MNLIYSNSICRVLVAAMLAVAAFEFLPEARAFSTVMPNDMIFTNAAPRPIPRRASIIFIQVDGLGYGDLSCYGQTKFQTPNLDKLAAEGIRFTNYSIAMESIYSHELLLFGKISTNVIPSRVIYAKYVDALHALDGISVAQLLKNSGYHTGLIGEWNLGDENSAGAPWKKGFDEFAGYLDPAGAGNFYADYIFRYAPHSIINETNNQFDTYIGREPIIANDNDAKSKFIPDVLAKAAANFIKENVPDEANHYRPFFLLLDYNIPDEKIAVPTDAPLSEESWPQPEKNRAALILRIDGYVGQLREQLQKTGMTNNVVIFVSSGSVPRKTADIDPDFFHSNLSTNDFRAPMIVNWPERIPAGQVSDYKWSPKDFLPTAAEIAFTQSPTNIEGTSVLPVLLEQTPR